MRIYLAAPWDARDRVVEFASLLEQAGHSITEKWWLHHDVGAYPHTAVGKDLDELRHQAFKDILGVKNADRFVLLQLGKSEGKAVETGIALECRIPICVFSPEAIYGNLFHYLPQVKLTPRWQEVIEWLK